MPQIFHAFVNPVAADPLIAGTKTSDWNTAHADASGNPLVVRTVLTADTNYYVSATGSDSNDGSIGSPWATIQHAVNFLPANIDFAGFTVTINIGAGTFDGPFIPAPYGGGVLRFEGASAATTILRRPVSRSNIFDFQATPGSTIISLNNVTLDGGDITNGGVNALVSSGATGMTMYFGTFNGSGGGIILKLANSTGGSSAITSEGTMTFFFTTGSMTVDGAGQLGTGQGVLGPTQGPVYVDFTSWIFLNTPNFGAVNPGFGTGFISPFWFGIYLSLQANYSGAFTGAFLSVLWGSVASLDTFLSGSSPNVIDPTSSATFTLGTSQGWGGFGSITKAGLPSTTELPLPNTAAVFKDTSGGGVYLAYNDAGVIKKVALT